MHGGARRKEASRKGGASAPAKKGPRRAPHLRTRHICRRPIARGVPRAIEEQLQAMASRNDGRGRRRGVLVRVSGLGTSMCTHGASAGKTQDVRPQSESQITFPRGEERGRKNGAAAGVAMVVVVVVALSSLLCLGGLETGNSPRHR